jgi:hypothetical protein
MSGAEGKLALLVAEKFGGGKKKPAPFSPKESADIPSGEMKDEPSEKKDDYDDGALAGDDAISAISSKDGQALYDAVCAMFEAHQAKK